jgi:hypothetical protein
MLDLFTETGKAPQSPQATGLSTSSSSKVLFLHNVILFKCCAETKIALRGDHLDISPAAYSQSYPQILWVRDLLFFNNYLSDYAKSSSRFFGQTSEMA